MRRGRRRVAAVAAVAAIAGVALRAPDGLSAQRPHATGWAVAPDVALRVFVPAGRVRLEAWGRDSVDVRGTIGAAGALFGGGTRTALKVGLEPAVRGDARLPSADWVVRVPARARVFVKMVDGTIASTGARGELELYTISGRIAVRDAVGVVSVESVDAPVDVERVSGSQRVRTGRGTVRIADAAGTLSVTTVGGAVVLERTATDGRVETIGGRVVVDRVARGGRLEVQTHDGPIDLRLPRAERPRLELASHDGAVRGDGDAGRVAHGTIVARSFRGTVTVTPPSAAPARPRR